MAFEAVQRTSGCYCWRSMDILDVDHCHFLCFPFVVGDRRCVTPICLFVFWRSDFLLYGWSGYVTEVLCVMAQSWIAGYWVYFTVHIWF